MAARPPLPTTVLHGHGSRGRRPVLPVLAALQLAVVCLLGAGSSAPADAACGSFQALVNAAASGSTLTVPPCTYHEEVWVRKPLTIHASGVVIDGDNARGFGLAVTSNDVTVSGLTVTRVNSAEHGGAVWTTGISRFTFQNGVARDSSTICVSLNGGSGHRILDSELTGCGKEGYFTNDVSATLFARNHIHHNNTGLQFNAAVEAGGGKALNSRGVTFDANEVDHNGGPGIWYDGGSADAIVTGNRVHDNNRAGIFFEISSGATITGNAVWNNGFGFVAWGYGAGITISSSDRADVHHNTVAWNARGISVISQAREFAPHDGNVTHDNVVVSQAGSFVSGWYDDHGGTLFSSGSGNNGYGNRYWIGETEPTQDRFSWAGAKTTLAAFDATPGEQGASYLTAAQRDSTLAAAGIPAADGTILPGTPAPTPSPTPGPGAPSPTPGSPAPTPTPGSPAPTPTATPPAAPGRPVVSSARLEFGTGRMAADATLPGRASWPAASGAVRYQAQVQRNGGAWQSLAVASPTTRTVNLAFSGSNRYRVRVRAQNAAGAWGSWAYSATGGAVRLQESNPSLAYSGRWALARRPGSSGVYARHSSTATSTVQLRFTGSAVSWIAPRGTGYGSARVYVDGRLRSTVDLQHDATLLRTVAFRTSWSTRATHSIVIQVVGTSGHPKVELDAFAILR